MAAPAFKPLAAIGQSLVRVLITQDQPDLTMAMALGRCHYQRRPHLLPTGSAGLGLAYLLAYCLAI